MSIVLCWCSTITSIFTATAVIVTLFYLAGLYLVVQRSTLGPKRHLFDQMFLHTAPEIRTMHDLVPVLWRLL